jgi:hypothetical protein
VSVLAETKEKRYVSDNAQLMAEWNWDKKTCEKKLSCEVINIPTEQLKE